MDSGANNINFLFFSFFNLKFKLFFKSIKCLIKNIYHMFKFIIIKKIVIKKEIKIS